MKKQQGFAPVLAVLIILIVLGGGAYLYTKNKVVAPVSAVPIVATTTPSAVIPNRNPDSNSTITFSSPKIGAIYYQGDTGKIKVKIQVPMNITSVFVGAGGDTEIIENISGIVERNFPIPKDYTGELTIVAIGKNGGGEIITGATTTVQIQRRGSTKQENAITSIDENKIIEALSVLRVDAELYYGTQKYVGFCATQKVSNVAQNIAQFHSSLVCRTTPDGSRYLMYAKLNQGYYCLDLDNLGINIATEPPNLNCK